MRTASFVAICLFALTGCRAIFDGCTGTAQPGLLLIVADAQTGGRPSSDVVIAIQGTTAAGANYVDTVRLTTRPDQPSQPSQVPLIDFPGTYSFTLTAAGYQTLHLSNYRLEWDSGCDTMETKRVTASLVRSN